ncbi:ABC transporter ATP-binding protein [Phocaeicola sp.]|uniref:ABC transporter ATP-binding protein n=1 Tax=Phocaeicola sp. TaxID=2773926 RepID=UPI003AB15905
MRELIKKLLRKLTKENIHSVYHLGRKAMRWVMQVTAGYHWLITFSIFSGIFGVGMSLFNVWLSKWIIDIVTGAREGNVWIAAGLVVFFFFFGMAVKLISPWIFGKIRMRIGIRMQNSLSDALMMCSWKSGQKWHTGDLLTRINSDASEVLSMGMGILPNLIVTTAQLIGSFIFLWALEPRLAWFILGATPLVLLSKIYFRKVRELSKAQKEMSSEMGSVMEENLSQRVLVRSLGATDYRKQKLHQTQEKLFNLGMEQIKFSTYSQGVMGFVFGGGYLCAFLWGIYQLHTHQITFGTMTAFLQLVGQVQGPFLGLIAIPPALVRGWTSVERLMALFEDVEPDENPKYLDSPLALTFNQVTFSYEEGQPILKNFSAEFRPGTSTAVAGPTGTGKTTMIRLMLALLSPDSGNLTLTTAGNTIYNVNQDMRINFMYVPQGNTLLSGTIRENLLLGNPAAQTSDLEHVLRIACADYVFDLPQGIDTRIGEHGYGLSEGQAQRLAIARALLRPGNIWLFDEASSALDTATTARLMDNLLREGAEKTLIFITHDPRLMERCDRVINLNECNLNDNRTEQIKH